VDRKFSLSYVCLRSAGFDPLTYSVKSTNNEQGFEPMTSRLRIDGGPARAAATILEQPA